MATTPELGWPPTMTINKSPSRIGVLPTPKESGGTSHPGRARCQIQFAALSSKQTNLPSAAERVAAVGGEQGSATRALL